MEIKIGRRTFNLTGEDKILDNGACYQLITQTIRKGYDETCPVISKTAFNKLLKEDKVVKTEEKYRDYFGRINTSCVIWKIKE